MDLGLTQPLTKMSTRRADKPYHLHVPTVLKSGSLNFLEPSAPVQACYGIALPHKDIISKEIRSLEHILR
jgi:hypothetical protein